MRVAYRGNFGPPYSTESHVAGSLTELGHDVVRIQEDTASWAETTDAAVDADLFLWTSTYGYALNWERADARAALAAIGARIPTVGLHLDLWFGLDRARQVAEEPFFQDQRWVFTADGDHDDDFAAAGVNHRWSPPAVYGPECVSGIPRRRFASDVAFVGSWQHYGHEEWWPHRHGMLDHLRRRYRNRVKFWPRGQAVRGADLNDLYASTKIVVGDSCHADRSVRYFSDRAFETVGRGGFLVMPWIAGLAELLADGVHCAYFPAGDHAEMHRVIDHYLAHDDERERIRVAGQAHVRDHHTYAHRLEAILATVAAETAVVA